MKGLDVDKVMKEIGALSARSFVQRTKQFRTKYLGEFHWRDALKAFKVAEKELKRGRCIIDLGVGTSDYIFVSVPKGKVKRKKGVYYRLICSRRELIDYMNLNFLLTEGYEVTSRI